MSRAAGDTLLVRYVGERTWHARVVLAHAGVDDFGHDYVVILTPDGDIYEEDIGPGSQDIEAVRQRVLGAPLPFGVQARDLYDFGQAPTAAEVAALTGEAERTADGVRRNLRLMRPVDAAAQAAPPVQGVQPALPQVLAPCPAGAPPAVPVPAAQGPVLPVHAPCAAAAAHPVVQVQPPPPQPGVAQGAGGGLVAPQGPVVGRQALQQGGMAQVGGGLAALAAALGGAGVNVQGQGGTGPVAGAGQPNVGAAPLAPVQAGAGAPATSVATSPPDIRVLPVAYDSNGDRFRTFTSGVELLDAVKWPDSPLGGPATVRWVCQFIRDNAGTPTSWHAKWVSICRLQASDAGVSSHEAACKALEVMVTFDQLNVGSLAVGELVARQIQLSEERWRDRVPGGGTEVAEARLFAGYDPRGCLCICPDLSAHVAAELQRESSVMKERRKAREERALLKPSNPGGKDKKEKE